MEKAMIKNMVEKTGKPIDEWLEIVINKEFNKHSEIVAFLKIIVFSVIFMFIYLSITNKSMFEISLRSISFNVISILTEQDMLQKTLVNGETFH